MNSGSRGRRGVLLLLVLVFLVAAGAVTWAILTRSHLTPEERGRRLAESTGCFACHGPEGTRGAFNPGRTDVVVPNWRGDLMMFASSAEGIRQWISDGHTTGKAKSQSWLAERDKGALRMPAFKDRLSNAQIVDLVALVRAVNGVVPEDSIAAFGMSRADSLGCFGCHGPGGRFARPNPGSFKGYVASWETSDFADLVENRAEFDQWVNEGVCDRLGHNRIGSFFLNRAQLKMPAFKSHLQAGDLDALWAYVQWLRKLK